MSAAVGLAVMLVFYGGYWQISYRQNVVRQGPGAVALVRAMTGLPGAAGYFVYHCRRTRPSSDHGRRRSERPPTRVDEAFNYLFHGFEVALLGGFGVMLGRGLSRRVFYEAAGRWGKSVDVLIPWHNRDAAHDAVEAEDWDALARLPRLASDSSSGESMNAVRVRFEFLPAGGRDAVAYVSVPSKARSRMAGPVWSALKAIGSGEIRQRGVSPESAAQLAAAFPEQITVAPTPAPATTSASIAPWAVRAPLVDRRQPGPVAMVGPDADAPADERARDLAVAACKAFSRDPLSASGAAVFAADVDQLRQVRRHNWGFNLILTACLVVGLGSAIVMIVTLRDSDGSGGDGPMTPTQVLFTTLFVGGLSTGLLVILFYQPVAARLRRGRLARRPGSLLPEVRGRKVRSFRLSFLRQFPLKDKGVDDLVACAADPADRRLLIEGVRYRYVIPADAVRHFAPLQSGETLALQLDFEVAGHLLQVVLARDNVKAHFQGQLPFVSAAGDADKLWRRMSNEMLAESGSD